MKKTAAANARSRHLSNRSNLSSSAAPGQGLNDSTAAERKERRLLTEWLADAPRLVSQWKTIPRLTMSI